MQSLQAFKATRPMGHAPTSRRTAVSVRAAVAAKPVQVPVKAADGASAGSEELALGVAPPTTAKGLVHRYLVYVQQNARQVLQCDCWLGLIDSLLRPAAMPTRDGFAFPTRLL